MERAIVYAADMPESSLEAFDVVYVGNEFCERKLPSAHEFERLLSMCARLGKKVAFLTPYVSDAGMEVLGRHLEVLIACKVPFEVVVNDWGFLNFLASNQTEGRLIAGRLLSARYMQQGHAAEKKVDAPLFPEGFLRLLEEFGIAAVEFNAPGQAQACAPQLEKIQARSHLYDPFMYVTTSRYCSAPQGYRAYARTPGEPCDQACDRAYAVVHSKDLGNVSYLMGNTYFVKDEMNNLESLPCISRIIKNDAFGERS